tara:strand:+ start:2151 stop:2336 length:186 start_codon:yes stop_codon:yes gene_type:complete
MLIVNDIQDASVIEKKLSSIVRRSVNFNKSEEDILVELMFVIEDLRANINRIDQEMSVDSV